MLSLSHQGQEPAQAAPRIDFPPNSAIFPEPVLRKLTGSTFAVVLIAIIAVKHVALGFCLCTSEFFVAECPCTCELSPAETCCPCEQEKAPAKEPCNDCTIPISLDVGDFLWSADAFLPGAQATLDLSAPVADSRKHLAPTRVIVLRQPIRGSPPGGPPPGLLRTTILRL